MVRWENQEEENDALDKILLAHRWKKENAEEEIDALDKISSSLIDERIFHSTFMLLRTFNILTVCIAFDSCKCSDVKHATILRHVCTHRSQRGPMDKEAFERKTKQRMAFKLYTLQEFWRNLGVKKIPPGALNGIISQTKAELNADWLSVTPS